MDIGPFIKGLLERNDQIVLKSVTGLTTDDLHKMPTKDTNPAGWLLWHSARVQDRAWSAFTGKEQMWIADGWHAKFGMKADPLESGGGHTLAQVAAFRAPDLATLLDYYRACRKAMDGVLDTVTPADLDRQVPAFRPPATVPMHSRMHAMALEVLQHGGQIAYLRGLIKGFGWY